MCNKFSRKSEVFDGFVMHMLLFCLIVRFILKKAAALSTKTMCNSPFAELWFMKKVFGRTAYQAGCALLAFFLPVMKQ